ncbi:sensor histidine kinase N-terminal domain-containing protein [Aeromonas jandaei]
MLILWAASAWYSYYGALAAATSAYDRTLLASARTVAERLTAADGGRGQPQGGCALRGARQLRAQHARSPLLSGARYRRWGHLRL